MPTIIVPTDQPTIKAAVDIAVADDIIQVLAGTYKESVVLDKKLILEGDKSGLTIIQGDGRTIGIKVTAEEVEIKNITVANNSIGIFTESNNTTITSCLVMQNIIAGISLYGEGHTVSNNQINNNTKGIILNSVNTNILSNSMMDNKSITIENVEETVTGSQIKYNKISNSEVGLAFVNSNATTNTISINTIHKCDQGIILNGSTNDILTNSVTYCSVFGINIYGDSNNIKQNSINNNTEGLVISGEQNVVKFNNITQNTNVGLTILGGTEVAKKNDVSKNIIVDNGAGVSQLNDMSIDGDNCVYANVSLDIIPFGSVQTSNEKIEPKDTTLYMEKFIPKAR